MSQKDCRRTRELNELTHAWVGPKAFADLLTADYKTVAEKDPEKQSVEYDRVALVILDYFIRLIDSFPSQDHTSDSA